jgi:hypothetical protein
MYLFETITRLIVLFSIRKSQSSLQKGGVHEFFTINETIISNKFNVKFFRRTLFDDFYALFRLKNLLSFNKKGDVQGCPDIPNAIICNNFNKNTRRCIVNQGFRFCGRRRSGQ